MAAAGVLGAARPWYNESGRGPRESCAGSRTGSVWVSRTTVARVMNMTARFDERDNVFSRRDLAEGTPESVEYYSRHPELLERDRYFKSLGGFGQGIHPADFDMFDASSWFMTRIGSPDAVDGTPVGKTIKLTPERFTEKIKSLGPNPLSAYRDAPRAALAAAAH